MGDGVHYPYVHGASGGKFNMFLNHKLTGDKARWCGSCHTPYDAWVTGAPILATFVPTWKNTNIATRLINKFERHMLDNAEHVAFTQDFINNVYARKDEADWRFIVSRFDVLRTKYPNHVPAPVAGEQLPLALPAPPAPLPPALCTKKSPYFPAPELPPEPLEPSGKRPRWADEGNDNDDDDEMTEVVFNPTRAPLEIGPNDSVSRCASPSLASGNGFRLLEAGRPGANKPSIAMEPEQRIVEQVSTFKFVDPLYAPTREQQFGASCGQNSALVTYAKQQYGHVGSGGMSTTKVATWYKRHMDQVPSHLQGREFGNKPGNLQVCHIISDAIGGAPWVFNYVIATKEVNDYFREKYTAEWERYVGREAAELARYFQKWLTKKAAAVVAFGSFDHITDKFLARGRL